MVRHGIRHGIPPLVRRDAEFVLLAVAHGVVLLTKPPFWVIALGLWWNANTIAHNFIHLPFFSSRAVNGLFSIFLSLVLGLPQTLWRQRHLAHHAGKPWRWRNSPPLILETIAVLVLWLAIGWFDIGFLLTSYLPGFLIGLGLCQVHGAFEHPHGAIVSHYGRFYNWLFFNDGYHVEHHRHPSCHWSDLPDVARQPHLSSGRQSENAILDQSPGGPRASRWPAVLRWLEGSWLDALERLVLLSPRLQQFVLRHHERAFRALLEGRPRPNRVAIIGGGLFPRTLMVLQRLLPEAHFLVVDANPAAITCARTRVKGNVEFLHHHYDPARPHPRLRDVDLVVLPLAYRGDRRAFYLRPPAPVVLIHDWLWHSQPAAQSAIISPILLKRLNLVDGKSASANAAQEPVAYGLFHKPAGLTAAHRAMPGCEVPIDSRAGPHLPPLGGSGGYDEVHAPNVRSSVGWLVPSLCLFLTFLLAKALAVVSWDATGLLRTAPMLSTLWQDALVVGGIAALSFLLRRTRALGLWFLWLLYGAILLYTAVNVPVSRILSSPLTWTMTQAAGGPLADSIRHYLTPLNAGFMLAILACGASLPWFLRRLPQATVRIALLVLTVIAISGALLVPRSAAPGTSCGHNALYTYCRSLVPVVAPAAPSESQAKAGWRSSFPLPRTLISSNSPPSDLARFRGTAAGRNVVLVILESTGAQYLEPSGGDQNPMPHLSRLAQDAIRCENTYCVYPESIRGLFSTLCSEYPALHTPPGDYHNVRTPSLAQCLRQSGYRTGLFHSGRFAFLDMDTVLANRGFDVLHDAGHISGQFESSFGVDESSTVAHALRWVDTLPPDQRFFLAYLPIAGHHPYITPAPGPFTGAGERTDYLNALHYADQSLEALLDGLRQRHLDTNTLLVIFGDHGEAFGQHEGNYGHTQFLFEENLRVPFLIAAPGLIQNAWRRPEPVSLLDTAPTVLDLLGLPVPGAYQGVSILQSELEPLAALFCTDYASRLVGFRQGPWKFICDLESRHCQLYDLESDPAERLDLSALHPEFVRAWESQLASWAAAQRHSVRQAAVLASLK